MQEIEAAGSSEKLIESISASGCGKAIKALSAAAFNLKLLSQILRLIKENC